MTSTTAIAAGPTAVLCLIVAVAENDVIGNGGKMPWHLPAELKYFRSQTIGKPVIMGRKTFQSIGTALPGRDNIVITRDPAFVASGVLVVGSLGAGIAAGQAAATASGASEIMVIGGAEIYAHAFEAADRIYLTRIHAQPTGDTFFPALDPAIWSLTRETALVQPSDEKLTATLQVFERKR